MNYIAPPHKLLLVDDNRVNRLLIAKTLQQLGHRIETADNGREALARLRREPFDLILADVEMPEMNGYELLDACLRDPELRHIPIIMTSAVDAVDSIIRCIELGAEDYLTKPVNPVLLRARVNASLEKKKLRDEHRRLIRTFADRGVAEQLMREGFALGGEYAVITAMCCDIRNFTTLTELHGPAAVIELVNGYYRIVIETVESYGGNANQMMGDGVMSFFGAPVHHPDHARRAVECAIELVRQTEAYDREQERKGKLRLSIGVGIATGQVIAGYAGTETRATYLCIGDTVNLSARLESHTKEVGRTIVLDDATRAMLGDSIELEPLGEHLFKGKTKPVAVFAVRRPGEGKA